MHGPFAACDDLTRSLAYCYAQTDVEPRLWRRGGSFRGCATAIYGRIYVPRELII